MVKSFNIGGSPEVGNWMPVLEYSLRALKRKDLKLYAQEFTVSEYCFPST